MIIGPNYVFVHNAKTGGVSISKALDAHAKEHGYEIDCQSYTQHAQALEISRETRANRLVFGFVRDPLDRLLSMYSSHFREVEDEGGYKEWLLEGRTMINGNQSKFKARHVQVCPQHWWLESCDVVGRFENLVDDFTTILNSLNMTSDLGHFNRSKHPPASEVHDAEMRAAIYDWHAVDYETYGYVQC